MPNTLLVHLWINLWSANFFPHQNNYSRVWYAAIDRSCPVRSYLSLLWEENKNASSFCPKYYCNFNHSPQIHNTIDYMKHFIMQTLYINILDIFIITTSFNCMRSSRCRVSCRVFILYRSLQFTLEVCGDDSFGFTLVTISTSPSGGIVTEELLLRIVECLSWWFFDWVLIILMCSALFC